MLQGVKGWEKRNSCVVAVYMVQALWMLPVCKVLVCVFHGMIICKANIGNTVLFSKGIVK